MMSEFSLLASEFGKYDGIPIGSCRLADHAKLALSPIRRARHEYEHTQVETSIALHEFFPKIALEGLIVQRKLLPAFLQHSGALLLGYRFHEGNKFARVVTEPLKDSHIRYPDLFQGERNLGAGPSIRIEPEQESERDCHRNGDERLS